MRCSSTRHGETDDDSNLRPKDFMMVLMTKSQNDFVSNQLNRASAGLKICMDSTHGIGSYGFELTTIMMVSDLNEGFPIAFCISSVVDSITMTRYREAVREHVGILNAKVFMSDDAPVFINAWKSVMGQVEHPLLCTWHVDRAFRQNLGKIQGSENKVVVYKLLRTLLEERDEEKLKKNACGFPANASPPRKRGNTWSVWHLFSCDVLSKVSAVGEVLQGGTKLKHKYAFRKYAQSSKAYILRW